MVTPWPGIKQSPLVKMAAILADGILKCIYLNENGRIPIQISLNYIPSSPTENKSALVQVMAWRRTGDKPLPELMLVPEHRSIYAVTGGDELKWLISVTIWHNIRYTIAFIKNHNFTPSCTAHACKQQSNTDITVPGDVLTPDGSWPSADTRLAMISELFITTFFRLSMVTCIISEPYDVIPNVQMHLMDYHGNSIVTENN